MVLIKFNCHCCNKEYNCEKTERATLAKACSKCHSKKSYILNDCFKISGNHLCTPCKDENKAALENSNRAKRLIKEKKDKKKTEGDDILPKKRALEVDEESDDDHTNDDKESVSENEEDEESTVLPSKLSPVSTSSVSTDNELTTVQTDNNTSNNQTPLKCDALAVSEKKSKKTRKEELTIQLSKNKELISTGDGGFVNDLLYIDDDGINLNIQIINDLFSKNEKSIQSTNGTVLCVERRIVEEWLLIHFDVAKVLSSSILEHINEISESFNNQCKANNPKYDKQRRVRSWVFIIIRGLFNLIWDESNKKDTIIPLEKDDKDAEKFKTPQSNAYSNLYDLMKVSMQQDTEHFPESRISTVFKCLKLNDSWSYRMNYFPAGIENVEGTEEGIISCDHECDLIVKKRKEDKERKQLKKKGVLTSDKSKDDSEQSTVKSKPHQSSSEKTSEQTVMTEYYQKVAPSMSLASLKEEKEVDIGRFHGKDSEELLEELETYFLDGLNSIRSSLLASQDNGSCIILDNKCIEDNHYVLKQLLVILEDFYSGDLIMSELIENFENIFKSNIINYNVLKFTNTTLCETDLFSIRSDGYCMYRTLYILAMSYISNPFDGKTSMEEDTNGSIRYDIRNESIRKNGNTTFSKEPDQDWTEFQKSFILFWTSVTVTTRKHLKELKVKHDMDYMEDDTHQFSFEYLLSCIDGMLLHLKKSQGTTSLPKDYWLEIDHIKLIAIAIQSTFAKKDHFCIPKNGLLMNIFCELDISQTNNNIDALLVETILLNENNFPKSFYENVCLILTISTKEIDLNQISESQRLFSYQKIKTLIDPSTNMIYKHSHVAALSFNDVNYKPGGLKTMQSFEINDMDFNINKITKSLISKLNRKFNINPTSVLLDTTEYNAPLSDKAVKRRIINIEIQKKEAIKSQEEVFITTVASEPKRLNMTVEQINSRYDVIKKYLDNTNGSTIAIDLCLDGIRNLFGTTYIYSSTAKDLNGLATLDNNSMISTEIINLCNHLINVEAYGKATQNEVYAYDIYNMSVILLAKSDEVILENRLKLRKEEYLESKTLLSKITLFPVWFDAHFILLVLLRNESMVVALDSFIPKRDDKLKEERNTFINEAMRKIILYVISIHSSRQITVPIDKWTTYIDGSDDDKEPIPQQGPTLNCGVHVCSYMMKIGFHNDIDAVVRLFKSKQYASLFQDINETTIQMKRKELTVAIVDRI